MQTQSVNIYNKLARDHVDHLQLFNKTKTIKSFNAKKKIINAKKKIILKDKVYNKYRERIYYIISHSTNLPIFHPYH